jgi:hypothetical protein
MDKSLKKIALIGNPNSGKSDSENGGGENCAGDINGSKSS